MPEARTASSSKKLWIVGGLLLVAALAVAAYAMVQKTLGEPSVDELLAQMPEDATVVVLARGLPKLALDFEVEDTFRRLAEENPEFKAKLAEMQQEWGFDPTRRESMESTGVDLLAPLGMAFTHHGDNRWSSSYFVPVSDRDAMEATIRRLAERNGETLTALDGGGGGSEDGTFRYGYRGDYLVAVDSNQAEDTESYLTRLLGGGDGAAARSLLDAEWLGDQRSVLDESWKIAVLGHLGDQTEDLLEALPPGSLPPQATRNLEEWRDVDTFGLRADLTPDRFLVTGQVHAVDDPRRPLNALMGSTEDRLAGEIPGKPLAGFRFAFDPQKALTVMLEDTPDMEAGLEQVEQMVQGMLGLDLRQDLIRYIGSPISMALFQDAGPWPVGAALWMPLKEEHGLDAHLDRLYGQFSEQGMPLTRQDAAGVPWYGVDLGAFKGRWSVAQGHLVIAAGQETANRVAEGLGEVGRGESVLGLAEGAGVAGGLSGESDAYFFADLPAVLAVLRQTPGAAALPPDSAPVLDNLGLLQARGNYAADRADGELTLEAAQPGGFRTVFRELVRRGVVGE
jgi:hypothetical protein